MGSASLSCASLTALPAVAELVGVVTQPDRPKGRHLKPQPSPVKLVAVEAGLPVLQPERARDPSFLQQLAEWRPELIVVAAYGQILPAAILNLPQFGCLNVHTSLLPRYRGAAPIQWAILNGDAETGVTIMKMDIGLDTGDILARRSTPIHPEDDSATLHNRLAEIGAQLLVETIPGYLAGVVVPMPQPSEGVTYAAKIKKEDGRIEWPQPAGAIWNRVRGLVPWPGAFCFLPSSTPPVMLKIWKATPDAFEGEPGRVLRVDKHGCLVGCGQGSLRLLEVQREGGKRLTIQQFLAGCHLNPGDRFQ